MIERENRSRREREKKIRGEREGRKVRKVGCGAEIKGEEDKKGNQEGRRKDKAERVSVAMQARGFDGNWRSVSKLQTRRSDLLFVLTAAIFILVLYFFVRPSLQ